MLCRFLFLFVAACSDFSADAVRSCKLTLYNDCEDDGLVTLGLGEYSKLTLIKRGVKRHDINAMRIQGDENCQAQLYQADNFTGSSRTWARSSAEFNDGKCHDFPDSDFNMVSVSVTRNPPGISRYCYFCTSQKKCTRQFP